MYNGERKEVELICDNDVMDAIIDKFGKDVSVQEIDNQTFRTVVSTSVGSVFYSWIFGFCGKVRIAFPADVKNDYAAMIEKAKTSIHE